MANENALPAGEHVPSLTVDDEMSLAEAHLQQTDESVPDTLEVRSDATSILHASLDPVRRNARAVAVTVGVVAVTLVAIGIIGRMRGTRPTAA